MTNVFNLVIFFTAYCVGHPSTQGTIHTREVVMSDGLGSVCMEERYYPMAFTLTLSVCMFIPGNVLTTTAWVHANYILAM